jgi:hypothetical protein
MKTRFFLTTIFVVSVAFGSSNPAAAERNWKTYCEGSPEAGDIPKCRGLMDNFDETTESIFTGKLIAMCPPDLDPDDPTGRPRAELCRLGHERDALARLKMKRDAREAKYAQILANAQNQPSQPEETTEQPSPQEGNTDSESDDGEEFQLSQSTNGSGEANQNNAQGSESTDSNLLSGNPPTNREDATSSSRTAVSASEDSEGGSAGLGAVILLGGFAGIGFGAFKGILFLISKFKK